MNVKEEAKAMKEAAASAGNESRGMTEEELARISGGKVTPTLVIYCIKAGDCLPNLAREYNTTVTTILYYNPQITDVNKIYIGQKILIPRDYKL